MSLSLHLSRESPYILILIKKLRTLKLSRRINCELEEEPCVLPSPSIEMDGEDPLVFLSWRNLILSPDRRVLDIGELF